MAIRIEIHGPDGKLDRFHVHDNHGFALPDEDLFSVICDQVRDVIYDDEGLRVTEIDQPQTVDEDNQ
jgi:hypothetical protein